MDRQRNETPILMKEVNNLSSLFKARLDTSPDDIAFIHFDYASEQWLEHSWQDTAEEIARWQDMLKQLSLKAGDRVAILYSNTWNWVVFEQAALGLELVVVPLYTNDRAENIGYILQDASVRLLYIQTAQQWQTLSLIQDQLAGLSAILCDDKIETDNTQKRVYTPEELIRNNNATLITASTTRNDLATIVYTSGTTGRPKGVMLSHGNILFNVEGALQRVDVFPSDKLLSFLPLSHMFERTVGYYIAMKANCRTYYSRSIEYLAEDILLHQPTALVAVPRIFERIYNKIYDKVSNDSPTVQKLFNKAVEIGWKRFNYQQGRQKWFSGLLLWPVLEKLVAKKIQAKMGGHIRLCVCGGAALPPDVAKLFVGLGIPILQGFGLTETSPIITANNLQDNDPASVGKVLEGLEIKLDSNKELLTRGPCVMMGYLNNAEATAEVIDKDGWFHSGDIAEIRDQRVYITGRIKDIIVLSNGEKVPPSDMEIAIARDPIFEQVLVLGEGKPFLSALIVLEKEQYATFAKTNGFPETICDACKSPEVVEALLSKVKQQLHAFPGYAVVRQITIMNEPWTIENEMATPTLKLKRKVIIDNCQQDIANMYSGH